MGESLFLLLCIFLVVQISHVFFISFVDFMMLW